MYTDVSIDLETLGVTPGSVITQIGLCAFNRRGHVTSVSATNIKVDPQSMIDRGFYVDWSTIKWWLRQNEAARVGMAEQEGHVIERALYNVGDWFAEHFPKNDAFVWGHGCGFDCTQLEIAFTKLKLPVPWDFRRVRDLRTLLDLRPAEPVVRPTPDVEHDAMADAIAQAHWIRSLTESVETRTVHVHADEPQFQP